MFDSCCAVYLFVNECSLHSISSAVIVGGAAGANQGTSKWQGLAERRAQAASVAYPVAQVLHWEVCSLEMPF